VCLWIAIGEEKAKPLADLQERLKDVKIAYIGFFFKLDLCDDYNRRVSHGRQNSRASCSTELADSARPYASSSLF